VAAAAFVALVSRYSPPRPRWCACICCFLLYLTHCNVLPTLLRTLLCEWLLMCISHCFFFSTYATVLYFTLIYFTYLTNCCSCFSKDYSHTHVHTYTHIYTHIHRNPLSLSLYTHIFLSLSLWRLCSGDICGSIFFSPSPPHTGATYIAATTPLTRAVRCTFERARAPSPQRRKTKMYKGNTSRGFCNANSLSLSLSLSQWHLCSGDIYGLCGACRGKRSRTSGRPVIENVSYP